MAAYMPQPDPGNSCCDCSERSGPCEDCGGGDDCATGPTGSCQLCKICNDGGYSCIDDLTERQCESYVPFGYTTRWVEAGLCAGQDPCVFSNCCMGSGLGMCCDESCNCLDGILETDCFGFGGTCWKEDCQCALTPGIGCGVCGYECESGACCHDGICSVETYSVCVGLGGAYLGGFTSCPNSVCDLCCSNC